jgi:hypothetical protein
MSVSDDLDCGLAALFGIISRLRGDFKFLSSFETFEVVWEIVTARLADA